MSGQSSTPRPPVPDRAFRRLSKNDIHQTTDQWRERTLQRLGDVSGRWTAWVEKDNVPAMPTSRPRPPVKPTSEALMLPLKQSIRARLFLELLAAQPKGDDGKPTESKTIDVIAMPSDYDAWVEYEELKSKYLADSREYERREKLALETFPDENRKVFSALIDCISEASVQDLKRTPDGARCFDEHDSYGFFKLAIQEHEYLPPAISSAAVARARDEFEGLRQKSEDTITEHVNEFRRRLDALLKARGPDGGSPYMDFDLRDLLLNSLYKPAWSSWIASREANDNMPIGFEALVLALKKAETTMILKGPSAMELHMPSAHSTRGAKQDSPSPAPPTSCQCCGVTFIPKRPAHIRCDNCQVEYSTKKKKDKKKSTGTESKKGKAKTTKNVNKKAHSTLAEDDADEDSDDNSEESATANFTSFSCICSTRASPVASGSLVYFDNCSNLNIIKDRVLALNVRKESVTTRISGSIPGSLASNHSADIGDLGRGCYDPCFSRNLISEDAAIKAGYRVVRDSQGDNNYYLHKDGKAPLVFSANAEGTFSTSVSALMQHFRELYATSNATDVDRTTVAFTKRQRERAERYHFDHNHCLGHLHPDRVIKALRAGLITNVPYTEADVRNSLVIHGPCRICSRAKGTKHRQTGHYPVLPTSPGERLAGDLFSIMGILFSLITCRLIKLRCVTKLHNKGAAEVTRAIGDAVGIWRGYGSNPKVLSWDQEPAVVSCASEMWAKHSLRLEFMPPEGHERVAERDVRTIKEHVYANILSLNHAVDAEMVEGLVRDTVTLLNFMPNSETLGASPRSILDGERLNYERWSRVYAGQVAEFEIPYIDQQKRGVRKEIGYVLGHQGDNPIVRLLPKGKRLVIRSGHIQVIDKSPAIIHLIEQGITGAARQHYNDLLTDIDEFFSDDTADGPLPPSISFDPSNADSPEPSPLTPTLPSDPEESPEPAYDPPRHEESPSVPAELKPPSASPLLEQPTAYVPSDEPLSLQRQETASPVDPASVPSSPLTTEPRRTSRAGASKPAGFYSKLARGDSVADSTACHMRATECSRLYGSDPTLEAGLSEVTNMIGRGAAIPEDFRLLSARTIKEALPSFLFYKAKEELPTSATAPTPDHGVWHPVMSKREQKRANRAKKIKLKGRWVGGGHRQRRAEVLAERVAPTARGTTHSIVMAIAAFEGRHLQIGDIPAAYLQADHVPANGRPVYIVADKYTTSLVVKAYPDTAKMVRPNGTMILRVAKAMYGLVESAWLWYKELERHLTGIGYSVSDYDRGLFYKKTYEHGKCVASNFASVHVDDIASAATNNRAGKVLELEFWQSMEAKWPGIKRQSGPHYKHLSWNIYQDPQTMEIRKSQKDYLLEVVKASGVDKEQKLPCRCDLLTNNLDSPLLPPHGVSNYRSTLQKIAYAREGRPDFDFAVSYLQGKQGQPTEQDWKDLGHLLGYIKRFPERDIIFKPKDLQLRGYADAAYNITADARSHYGYVITLGSSLISSKGGRIKTVVRSSTEAEISAVNEIVSELLWCRDILEELGYPQAPMPIREDNQSCITMLQQEPRNFHSKSKHVRVKWAFFREEYGKRTLFLEYCPTKSMVADLLTKPLSGNSHNIHSANLFNGVRELRGV